MSFEWDENKRQSNSKKHQIDFYEVAKAFETGFLAEWQSSQKNESRVLRLINLNETVIVVVYTLRDQKIRIISARRASEYERKKLNDL